MKVKCIKIFNEQVQEYQSESSWMTIGKEYTVLAIEIRQMKTYFLVVSDSNNQPVLQNAIQFEILSKKIPSNWIITPGEMSLCMLAPKAWCNPGFWEDCYDHDPKALEIYKREAKIIYDEEGIFL